MDSQSAMPAADAASTGRMRHLREMVVAVDGKTARGARAARRDRPALPSRAMATFRSHRRAPDPLSVL
jgi:hypothetical protein